MSIIQMLLGAFILSLAPLLVKPVAGEVGPLQINLWRAAGAALVLIALWRVGKPKGGKSLPICWGAGWQIFGAMNLGLNSLLFVCAMAIAPTAMVYVLAASTPAYTIVFQVFKGPKPRPFEYLVALAIVGGMVVFFRDGLGAAPPFGIGCAVLAGLTLAGYIYSQGKLAQNCQESLLMGTVILGQIVSALISAVLILGCIPAGVLTELTGRVSIPSAAAVGLLLLLGLQAAIPAWLWAKAMKSGKVPVFVAGAMPTLSAVWGPTWAALFISEAFGGWPELLGMVIVHGAVLCAVAIKKPKGPTENQ